jgi:hypothetical protein
MPININPNRINIATGATGKAPERRSAAVSNPVVAPKRAPVNYIPSPEAIRTLVAGAVEALKRGVYWDRGTILNLLV